MIMHMIMHIMCIWHAVSTHRVKRSRPAKQE